MISKQQKGFTLLELMLVIALLGVLAAIAMPSYRNFLDKQKVRSALNEWQNSYYFSQKEAMRAKTPVILCGSSDGLKCKQSPDAADFSDGWIIISDGKILQEIVQNEPRIQMAISSSNQFSSQGISFSSTGRIKNNAAGTLTVAIKDKPGGGEILQKSELKISNTGRLRFSQGERK